MSWTTKTDLFARNFFVILVSYLTGGLKKMCPYIQNLSDERDLEISK